MRTHRVLGTLAAAALVAAAAPASAQSFSVEGFGGYQNLRLSSTSVGNAVSGDEGTAIVGGNVLAGLGPLGVGLVVDRTARSNGPWAGAILGGLLVPLSVVRLEVLGELGRRGVDFGDIFNSNSQTFVGFRPGVSFRIPQTPLIIGASGIARWNTSNGDFGKPDYGIVGRVGLGMF
jgi:hypothetical protein